MSLFNRPAWFKSQAVTSETDEAPDNIFSHSSRSYAEIVAETERKKQAKAEKLEKKKKQKREEERKSWSKPDIVEDESTASSSKRRRISQDGEEEDVAGAKTARQEGTVHNVGLGERKVAEEEKPGARSSGTVRRSPRKNKYGLATGSALSQKQPIAADVVELGSSDDEAAVKSVSLAPQTTAVEVIEEESDDELAELARRARQQRQARSAIRTSHATEATASAFGTPGTGHERIPTPPPDPIIKLFISSRIENTEPVIVKRKLSQNIAIIRESWCAKQGFSEQTAEGIFFIHRMRRVYDVTTCRSLGLEVDALGNLILEGAEGKENVDQVHLEAVTDEIFQQMKAEREQRSRRPNGELEAQPGTTDVQPPSTSSTEETFLRIVLRAQGKDDYKLQVKPTTKFAKIIARYCKEKLDDGRDYKVRLEFDGETLNPGDEVQSTEVTDFDCLDVHISAS